MVIPDLPRLRPTHLRKWQAVDVISLFYFMYFAHNTKYPKVEHKVGYFRFKRKQQGDKHQTH